MSRRTTRTPPCGRQAASPWYMPYSFQCGDVVVGRHVDLTSVREFQVLNQFLVGHAFPLLAARHFHTTCNSAGIKQWL
jgi:hypothetical protein